MDAEWYSNLGVTISFSLVLGIFTPHASYFAFAFLTMGLRYWDSGCRRLDDMQKQDGDAGYDGNDPEAIDVHTGQLIQPDLNTLWTGEEIYAHYIYASIYSYVWVVLMYSTGLPVLYICGFLFFVVFYWAYKWLLLKYYKRTEKFNERLPIAATVNIPVGLVIHLCFGALMISNSKILSTNAALGSFTESGKDLIDYIVERLTYTSSAEVFCAFGVLICVIMFVKRCCLTPLWNLCGSFGEKLLTCFICRIMGLSEDLPDETTSPSFYQELKPRYLKELYIKSKGELRALRKEMGRGGINPFTLTDYTGEDHVIDVPHVEKLMKTREIDIKRTINKLLVNIHGVARTKQHFGNIETLFKLRYLFKKQAEVKEEEGLMRMNDLIQSFDLMNSPGSDSLAVIRQKLEDNKNWDFIDEDK